MTIFEWGIAASLVAVWGVVVRTAADWGAMPIHLARKAFVIEDDGLPDLLGVLVGVRAGAARETVQSLEDYALAAHGSGTTKIVMAGLHHCELAGTGEVRAMRPCNAGAIVSKAGHIKQVQFFTGATVRMGEGVEAVIDEEIALTVSYASAVRKGIMLPDATAHVLGGILDVDTIRWSNGTTMAAEARAVVLRNVDGEELARW